MKPGAATSPRPSIRILAAAPSSSPTAAIVSPRIPTSAKYHAPPEPSTTLAPVINTSYWANAADDSRGTSQNIARMRDIVRLLAATRGQEALQNIGDLENRAVFQPFRCRAEGPIRRRL